MQSLMEPGEIYHIYNRGNNGDRIFFQKRNYNYFLQRLFFYLNTYIDLYAYCMLSNHFHLMIRIKTIHEIAALTALKSCSDAELSTIVSEQFRKFFLSYSKSVKTQENRSGSLFEKNFKRKPIQSPEHFTHLINYIHRNPETHGIVPDFRTYPFSSYMGILTDSEHRLKREAVLSWFGGREEFVRYHETNPV
jgi:putative transposase